MDKQLLQKYFRNQCTLGEIEQVLEWFQTDEGSAYFEEIVDRDMERYSEEENLLLYPDIPSDEMLYTILSARKQLFHKRVRKLRQLSVAAVILICCMLAGSSYWIAEKTGFLKVSEPEIVFRTISTLEDQHRLVTLGDGTRIRLNNNSSIVVPETFPSGGRVIQLNGEAYFDVARDESRPFTIQAGRAVIRVLGTQFNVRVDSLPRRVKVAVAEGKVSLSREDETGGRGAILTENTYAEFHPDSEEMLIERTPVENYMSWISGQLYFYNEPLWITSRYLERLYEVSFRFEKDQLRELPLSTRMARNDLNSVLDVIARTLGIGYRLENNTVSWIEKQVTPS